MRVEDERVMPGASGGVAHSGLSALSGLRSSKSVLCGGREIFAAVLRSGGIPDLAGEHAIAFRVARFECANAYRERAAREWVVIGAARRSDCGGGLMR